MRKKNYILLMCLAIMNCSIRSVVMSDKLANAIVAPNSLKIASNSFADQGIIPAKYSYNGGNISPQISWSAGPAGTKSYVVICQDPDAPRKDPWVHWVVFNIPADQTSLKEGIANKAKVDGIQQGRNDYPANEKQIGWGGPNPPSGIHRYYFYVYALDAVLSELKDKTPTKDELLRAMKSHKVLAQGSLMGTFAAAK